MPTIYIPNENIFNKVIEMLKADGYHPAVVGGDQYLAALQYINIHDDAKMWLRAATPNGKLKSWQEFMYGEGFLFRFNNEKDPIVYHYSRLNHRISWYSLNNEAFCSQPFPPSEADRLIKKGAWILVEGSGDNSRRFKEVI